MMFVDGVFTRSRIPVTFSSTTDGSITFVDFVPSAVLAPGMKSGVPMLWDGHHPSRPVEITEALREMGPSRATKSLGNAKVAERVIGYFQRASSSR